MDVATLLYLVMSELNIVSVQWKVFVLAVVSIALHELFV